jgi:hypothetical protein
MASFIPSISFHFISFQTFAFAYTVSTAPLFLFCFLIHSILALFPLQITAQDVSTPLSEQSSLRRIRGAFSKDTEPARVEDTAGGGAAGFNLEMAKEDGRGNDFDRRLWKPAKAMTAVKPHPKVGPKNWNSATVTTETSVAVTDGTTATVETTTVGTGLVPVKLSPAFFDVNGTDDSPTEFKYLLVENNVGDYTGVLGEPGHPCNSMNASDFPASCDWPSIRAIKATASIYSTGDHTEWSNITAFDLPTGEKFMVTVMAEGYRLCGGYFTVPDPSADPSAADEDFVVSMACQRHPLPLGTIRVFVFEDNAPCNGQYDGPAERPLFDFGIGVNDMEGPITEDYYGNSLLEIVSDEHGIIEVPHMWPMRYDIDIGPPPNEGWIKTNTLEGGHGWDYWLFEGWEGYDPEFIVGAERFPFALGAFVRETPLPTAAPDGEEPKTNVTLTGHIETASAWFPFVAGGMLNQPGIDGNMPGIRRKGPLFNQDGIVAISDLGKLDRTTIITRTDPDGNFTIDNFLPGSYLIAFFDITQRFILQIKTFTVSSSDALSNTEFDLGDLFLTGWYTEIHGFFFLDENKNGIMDDDEKGLHSGPFPVVRLRDGTQIDRGFQFEVPFNDLNNTGYYNIAQVYPLTSWFSMNFFHPLYSTTGYSYQMEFDLDDDNWTTVIQNDTEKELFDISLFGVPGVTTRLDVGFQLKEERTPVKGSIYGSVNYDTTRVNLAAEAAVVENHEPGLPNIKVTLTRLERNIGCGECALPDPVHGWNCANEGENITSKKGICTKFWVQSRDYDNGMRPRPELLLWDEGKLVPFQDAGGHLSTQTTPTEEFESPVNCYVKDEKGGTLKFPGQQQVVPNPNLDGDDGVDTPCIETPLLGNQVGGWTTVAGMFHFDDLEPGLYAIQVESPMDGNGTKPQYKIRTEDDINTYESDLWQWCGLDGTSCRDDSLICPSSNESCPVPLDPIPPLYPYCQNIPWPCAGALHTIGGDLAIANNPSFFANGGSHYGTDAEVHYCDVKIVRVEAGVTARPTFHLFTEVPIPSRWKGLVLDDVQLAWNPMAITYSELLGVPHMPIGIYDYKGVKLTDVETDANGYFEVLVPPSRNSHPPSASSIMSAIWCMRGNDPGTRGFPSKAAPLPAYRSISACFEAMPGRIIPVDLAPVTIAAPVTLPDGDIILAPCDLPLWKPELFNVHPEPICSFEVNTLCDLIIRGRNFGANGTTATLRLAVPTEQAGVEDGPYGFGGSAVGRGSIETNGIIYQLPELDPTHDEVSKGLNVYFAHVCVA